MHRYSMLNPIEWIKAGATIGGILLGGVHIQSAYGAWIGAFIASWAIVFGLCLIIILMAKYFHLGEK